MQSNSRYTTTINKYQSEDAWIADLDPIMQGGFKVAYYQPQFALEVRNTRLDGQCFSVKQMYSLRILALNSGEGAQELKMEIGSQQDIFKLYICKLDEKQFEKMKKKQHLNFSFQALINILIKQINLCRKEPQNYFAILQLNKVSSHRFSFLQNIEYKKIELLSLDFDEMDEEFMKNYVTFKFTKIKMNKQIIEKKLKDVLSMTKIKNQNLWADIIKKQTSKNR